jgi:hypothetical protein
MKNLIPAVVLLLGLVAHAQQPVLIVDHSASSITSAYVSFLQRETIKRAGYEWKVSNKLDEKISRQTIAVVLGTDNQMQRLLPAEFYSQWQAAATTQSDSDESFAVALLLYKGRRIYALSGRSVRAQLFAIGWLLRNAQIDKSGVSIPQTKAFISTPDKPVRGYQVGYRMKNNTYDAWRLSQFEQQMLDLAVFGLNTLQVVAPISDDDPTSPLFPAPAEETVIGLSSLSQKYGLRYDLFYPEMAKDYSDPQQVSLELRQFEDLVKKLPLVDSIHIPGGDPGHTPPEILLRLIEKESVILHRYHPKAEIWVSAQGFTRERYEHFYKTLQEHPRWLTGVFFGPQSREGMELQRRKIPSSYPIEFYPDTAHVMHSQFPVPQWDPIYALTESREPICPRPAGFQHIYQHFRSLNSGFIVYSEGVNDDVNKVLWGAWGWSPNTSAHQALKEYAHYFFHSNAFDADRIATSIEALEGNWSGPLLSNPSIAATLAGFERESRTLIPDWRWNSLLYRAVYDRYLQIKRGRELALETAALAKLQHPGFVDSRIASARSILKKDNRSSEEKALNTQLYDLAQKLFDEVGMQLSVKRYKASNWERGANLDRVETPLNDRSWIEAEFNSIQNSKDDEKEKSARLRRIAHWQGETPGTFYDDLGDPMHEPHLLRGQGWNADPEMYYTAIDGIADRTLDQDWRLSWLSYGETLYENPLHLHYDSLDPKRKYKLRITYAGEEYVLPMRMVANNKDEIHPFRLRRSNPETVEFDLPATSTISGQLDLKWFRKDGAGGGGRGGQVAEVWLIPR